MNTNETPNLETRLSNRLRSIFAAFGQVINDFYLEAGIYFVGGFNAALVAWGIYTTLASEGQPLAYAVALGIVAFIAVEGLAVYLVGAAAKTSNGLLWFFSVVFAAFFTYAHYQEMTRGGGVIAAYITLAIPFFVVVGYWARTVKADIEDSADRAALERGEVLARQQQIEDEERARQQRLQARREQIEDGERAHRQEIERIKTEARNELNRLKIEVSRHVAGTLPEAADVAGTLPDWLPTLPEDLAHFRKLVESGSARLPDGMSGAELARAVGRSPRTGQNWLKAVRNGVTK